MKLVTGGWLVLHHVRPCWVIYYLYRSFFTIGYIVKITTDNNTVSNFGGTCFVTVIVVGKGHGGSSSKPGGGCSLFT